MNEQTRRTELGRANTAADSATMGRRRLRPRALVLGIALGLLAGAFAVAIGLWLMAERPAPLLTLEMLHAAEARWRERGPRNYDVDLLLTGREAGEIHLEVRDGLAAHFVRDGHTPAQRRTWQYWTVPNQFGMIQQDFRSARRPRETFGASDPAQVILRGEFDPEYGYPRYYQRIVLGTPHDISWRVTEFTPRE